jgi:predicted phosphodiesterase
MCFGGDVVGGVASNMWDIIQNLGAKRKFTELNKAPHERKTIDNIRKFAESKGVYMLLGMKPDEKLVFGHTHKPFINDDRTVANTGSWVNEMANEQSQNTYVKVSSGQMELKRFDEKNFP